MPRLAGVDIPDNKPVWISLTYLYGIGRTKSYLILDDLTRGTRRLLGLEDVTDEGEEQERLSAMPPRHAPAVAHMVEEV